MANHPHSYASHNSRIGFILPSHVAALPHIANAAPLRCARRPKTVPRTQSSSRCVFLMLANRSVPNPKHHIELIFRHMLTPVFKRHLVAPSRPFVSRIASGALRLIIQSLCSVADDLEVDVDASSNFAALTGKLNGVSVRASSLEYEGFAVSGGVALHTDQISITTRHSRSALTSVPRLAKPFSVSIRATLTESDLNRPGPVRDALETLLRQTIATGLSGAIGRHLPTEIGGVNCVLDRVDLSDSSEPVVNRLFGLPKYDGKSQIGKLVLRAHATLTSGRRIIFAVRTGLATINDGNILCLSDPELLWRNFAFPMVTIDLVGIKFDVTTKLTDVRIEQGAISGDGIIVISPPPDGRQSLTSRVKGLEHRQTKRHVSREEIRVLPRGSRRFS